MPKKVRIKQNHDHGDMLKKLSLLLRPSKKKMIELRARPMKQTILRTVCSLAGPTAIPKYFQKKASDERVMVELTRFQG
jgi:hypothetical protein